MPNNTAVVIVTAIVVVPFVVGILLTGIRDCIREFKK